MDFSRIAITYQNKLKFRSEMQSFIDSQQLCKSILDKEIKGDSFIDQVQQ